MWNLKSLTAVATACAICVAGWWLYESGTQATQAKWDAEKLGIAEAISQELIRVRGKEATLSTIVEKLRKDAKDENARIAARHAAELGRLRDRYETRAGASGVPEGAAVGVGCTGAGLARLDATLLAGYASDAARLQLAYNECKAKYTKLSEALNGRDQN